MSSERGERGRWATLGLTALELLGAEAARSGPTGPRWIAVAFTDLEGFTQYTADYGDERAVQLLDDHHFVVKQALRDHGGRVVKRLGDGLMLSFSGANEAARAVATLVGAPPGQLRLRAGVHYGEAVVSREDVLGHMVNIAARVTELARGGTALATTAVRDAATPVDGVEFGRARRARLKGVPEKISVCELRRTTA